MSMSGPRISAPHVRLKAQLVKPSRDWIETTSRFEFAVERWVAQSNAMWPVVGTLMPSSEEEEESLELVLLRRALVSALTGDEVVGVVGGGVDDGFAAAVAVAVAGEMHCKDLAADAFLVTEDCCGQSPSFATPTT